MSKRQDTELFTKLGELLEQADLNDSASKDRIYRRLIGKLETGPVYTHNTKKDGIFMKKNKWMTSIVVAASIIVLGGAFSTTSYAQDIFKSIAAQFQVGNMKITQYNGEVPTPAVSSTATTNGAAEESREVVPATPKDLTVQEARAALEINFPAPARLLDYEFVNCIIEGKNMIGVNYAKGTETINFLISRGGDNGISTAGEVTTEIVSGTKVYHANGIVFWEYDGFTIEMYSQKDFDSAVLGTIIDSFDTGAPLQQAEIDKAKEKVKNAATSEVAAQVPADAR